MYRNVYCVLMLNVVLTLVSCAQNEADSTSGKIVACSGGLGVTLIRTNDIVDYVNSVSSSGTRVDDFGVAPEFFGSLELRLIPAWGVKLEYAYLLKSHPVTGQGFGNYSVSYAVQMPTILAQYVMSGRGYFFKFGGGAGYHRATVSLDYSSLGSIDYTSSGIGMKIEAEANTEFDEHLFGVITADMRNDIMSEVKDSNGKPLVIANTGKHVRMDFFSLGVKFGMIYYF